MRADRLLSIIWLLRSHGQLSTAELAERLEVSRRTVLRDVEALSSAGVPVYCERGSSGGVRLLPGYRTDVTGLSSDESRALFAAVTTWGADALGLGDALASGLRKLLAAVPDQYRGGAAEIAERIIIDPQGWMPTTEAQRRDDLLVILQQAVLEQRRLRIGYRGHQGIAMRTLTVDPHGLVASARTWYLCATDADITRFYRLSRIVDAELLVEPCLVDMNVTAAWKEHRARFVNDMTPLEVTAWVRNDRRHDVDEWTITVNPVVASDAPTPPTQHPLPPLPSDKEWSCLRLGFMDTLHALTVLVRLGGDIRIIEPDAIRATVVAHAQAILAANNECPSPTHSRLLYHLRASKPDS